MRFQDRSSRRAWRQHTILPDPVRTACSKEGSSYRQFCVFLLQAVETSRSARAFVQSQNDACGDSDWQGRSDTPSRASSPAPCCRSKSMMSLDSFDNFSPTRRRDSLSGGRPYAIFNDGFRSLPTSAICRFFLVAFFSVFLLGLVIIPTPRLNFLTER